MNNIWPGTERKGTEGRERERGRDVARDGELDDEGGGVVKGSFILNEEAFSAFVRARSKRAILAIDFGSWGLSMVG